MIDVGRLNKRVTFLRNKEKKDSMEQETQDLEPFKTVWASVEPISGKEFLEAQKTKNEITHKIFTRYIKNVNETMIIEFKGRKFKIISMINSREDNEILQFVCIEERKKDGT